jgi:ketosteroid isomerase-like protein
MVRAAFVGASLLVLVLEPGAARAEGEIEGDLLRLDVEWRKARVDGDAEFLERFYAKELRFIGTNGAVIERDTDIALFAARRIRPEYIEPEDMKVTLYDDVAIVTGLDRLKGTYNGVPGEGLVRFTHVYVHRDDRWQLVASHGSWVQ